MHQCDSTESTLPSRFGLEFSVHEKIRYYFNEYIFLCLAFWSSDLAQIVCSIAPLHCVMHRMNHDHIKPLLEVWSMIRLNTISMKFLFQLSCILKLGSFTDSLPHPTRSATSNSSASNQQSTVSDQHSAAPNENKVFAQFPAIYATAI